MARKEVAKTVSLRLDQDEKQMLSRLREILDVDDDAALLMKLAKAADRKNPGEVVLFVNDRYGDLTDPLRAMAEKLMTQADYSIQQNTRIIEMFSSFLESQGHKK